jgi:neurofibromin 1
MMTSMPSEHGFDLDPSKAAGQDVDQNQKNVQQVATAFLTIISASVPTLPPCVRL